MKIGDRIKQIRLSKNISQKQLASILNIPVSTLANYENNHREPKIETLKKIANALNIKLTDLMNDDLGTLTKEYLFQDNLLDISISSLEYYLNDKLLKDSEKAVLMNFTNDFLLEYTELLKSFANIERYWDNSYNEYNTNSSLNENELKILFLRENLNNQLNNISNLINNFPSYIVHNEIKEKNDNLSSDINE